MQPLSTSTDDTDLDVDARPARAAEATVPRATELAAYVTAAVRERLERRRAVGGTGEVDHVNETNPFFRRMG